LEFQRINRSDPERLFIIGKAGEATTAGRWYAWDLVTAQDGLTIKKAVGFNRNKIAGVATQTVASGEYVPVQVWGYNSSARCKGGDGSATSKLTPGVPMHFNTSGYCALKFARTSGAVKADYGKKACGFAIAPTNTAAMLTQESTSGAYKVFITCL
jgi:hypothetical protein